MHEKVSSAAVSVPYRAASYQPDEILLYYGQSLNWEMFYEINFVITLTAGLLVYVTLVRLSEAGNLFGSVIKHVQSLEQKVVLAETAIWLILLDQAYPVQVPKK